MFMFTSTSTIIQYMCRIFSTVYMVAFLLLIGTEPVTAALAKLPDLNNMVLQQGVRPTVQQSVGRMELVVGKVHIHLPGKKATYRSLSEAALAVGDIVTTGENGRARIVMDNHDVVLLGPGTQVGLTRSAAGVVISVWQGMAVVYGMPQLTTGKKPLLMHTPSGSLQLMVGKAGVEVRSEEERILTFANRLTWSGNEAQSLTLSARNLLLIKNGHAQPEPFAAKREQSFVAQVSPKGPAIQQAMQHFTQKEMQAAKQIFRRVQKAYPHDGVATYFLGLIAFENEDKAETIRQWRAYTRIDPEGAKEKQISQYLTLLISEQMKEEMKQALAQEQQRSSIPPEPNSVAVTPFSNHGDEQYRMLSKGLTAILITSLAKIPDLKVLEREKLQKLVDEIHLAQSGLTDKNTLIRAGKILKAEKVVTGVFTVE